jgi:hypothetical protein
MIQPYHACYKPVCSQFKSGSKCGEWKQTDPSQPKSHSPPVKTRVHRSMEMMSNFLKKKTSSTLDCTLTEDLPDYLYKMDTTRHSPHQNVLATRQQINSLPVTKSLATVKPIWTYRIQLWGTVSTSNIEILECFQSKTAHNSKCTLVCTELSNP